MAPRRSRRPAWWDLLQQQFGQIAAATAATMPAAAPSKVESEADKPAPKAAKTEAKPPPAQAGLEGRRPRQARRPQGSAQDGAVRLAPAP